MDIYSNNKVNDFFGEKEILPDLGIMMSYGDTDNLVTMGIFFIDCYYDETGKKLQTLPDDKTGVEVEFIEYELSDDLNARVKPNGCKVRMPYSRALKLYNNAASANFDKAFEICDTELEGRNFLSLFNEKLCEVFADYPELASEGLIGFQSNTLKSLDGSFISSDGHDMGDEFRVFPFLYDMIKRKILEKTYNNKIDKDKLYKYIYTLYYDFQNNKVKEKEEEINLGGTIYEPGPNSVPLPNKYYEDERNFELENDEERDRPFYR